MVLANQLNGPLSAPGDAVTLASDTPYAVT